MIKRITHFTFVFVLLFAWLLAGAVPAMAQSSVNDETITLAQIEGAEIFLNGPYDTTTVVFGLPADWKLTSDAQLNLNLSTALNVVTTSDTPALYGGLLTVKFNRQTVAIISLNNPGATEQTITIPAPYLVSPRSDGRMELYFELDSGISCQASQHMNVVINQSTQLTFPHEQIEPSTDLTNFPRPIYQDTIYPDSALVVIPDKPASGELQAAMSVAAGLGNLTSNKVALDLTTVSQLTAIQKNNNHLIFVGQAASLPDLANLTLPLPVTNSNFNLTGPDDGVVEMVNSPWNISKVVLVVSGNTEAGVIKAAQAVSTGSVQSNSASNLAIIESVSDNSNLSPLVLNQTLADLGQDVKVLNNAGVNSVGYNFNIPDGSTVSSGAFFELAYSHSALLNMDLSGIVVQLNGQPIGSIQFTKDTAAEAVNTIKFSLPETLVHPGTNRIDVRVDLEPVKNCSNPALEGLYAVIWPQSRLFMPIAAIQIDPISRLDLSSYPTPLSYDSTMSGIAFVLQKDDLNTWKSALQVAKYLGNRSNGAISMPKAFLDGDYVEADFVNYNLIVIGNPSQLSVMDKLNAALPIPFDIGTDQIADAYSQVTYRIPADAPQGYVELLASPWNKDKLVLAALGNTAEGITWAGSSLGDSPLRGQLAGNFAIIDQSQVKTADTRLAQPAEDSIVPTVDNTPSSPTTIDTTPPPPANINAMPPAVNQPTWIRPVLGITLGLSLLILIYILISNARKHKS